MRWGADRRGTSQIILFCIIASKGAMDLQVVAGTNFKLVLQTSSGNFEATVFSACYSFLPSHMPLCIIHT